MLTKEFITAGKAIFTVSNNNGEHYTFQITRKEASGKYPTTWFVALLTGPDNCTDYTYMGMLNIVTGAVNLTRKSRFSEQSTPVRVIRWALSKVWEEKNLPVGYSIHHEGKCGRCGRRLTVPESILSGIGPECAKHMGGPKLQSQPLLALAGAANDDFS